MKHHLLYINWDGFGRYYYDQMVDRALRLPTLTSLMQQGTFFENAFTGIPSITFPMQSAIVCGCYSSGTKNCDKYWDPEKNEIIPLRRYNQAETIGEVLKAQQIPFVSIQQFALQDKGAGYEEKNSLYVQPNGNFEARFSVLNELLQNQHIQTDQKNFYYKELPPAIFAYMDDLDAIGHNPPSVGAESEAERIKFVQKRLCQMDAALGKTIRILKNRGLWNDTYFLLTTDHGMISYKGASKMPQLARALRQMGCGKVIIRNLGPVQKDDFDVLLTSHDIQCQVYFKNPKQPQNELKQKLLQLPFVEQVLTREELDARGVCKEYADMVISPIEGCYFGSTGIAAPGLHATHDSLNEKCQKIFAYLSGPDVKKGYRSFEKVSNIDFLPALCQKCSIPIMNSAAPNSFLEDIFENEVEP